MRALDWIVRLVAAGVLLQTLYFKFSGAPESIYIFSTLGVEPWGRIASGVLELVASGLLLYSGTAGLGGLLAAGLMVGAIGSHLTALGIEVQGDGGLLFGLAWLVLLCSVATVVLHRSSLRFL
jgi:hypothetical protein